MTKNNTDNTYNDITAYFAYPVNIKHSAKSFYSRF